MRPQTFRTRLTDMLGIRHPILCGGLGPGVSDARYVAAAVNAGGMGFMVIGGYDTPDAIMDEMAACQRLTDGKGFGVNLYVSRLAGSRERILNLIPHFREFGVTVAETAGSNPEPLVPVLQEAGIRVLHKVPAVRYARTAARLGVDGVIIVGAECGGHPGTLMVGSMVQAAQAPHELDIPVVIGGGIGTGRQLAAVLAMGGEGVVMGTRMMVAEELWIHEDHKARMIAGDGTESTIIKKILRDHHRVLHNDTAREVLELEAQGVTDFELYRPLVQGSVTRAGYRSGDSSRGMYDWGQSAVFADQVRPMEEIYDALIDDAVAASARLAGTHAVAGPQAVLS